MTQDNDDNEMKIAFAPGAFDNFEGTQEELDELVAEIEKMVADGSLMENSEPLDLDALAEEDPEMALSVAIQVGMLDAALDKDGNLDLDLAIQLSDEDEAHLRSIIAGRLQTGSTGRLN